MSLEMESSKEWEIKSKIKEVCQFAPMDREVVKDKVSELEDVKSDEVEQVIQEMEKEGTLFNPDSKSIQRT